MTETKYEDMPEATYDAIHAVRDAQQAIEVAREAQSTHQLSQVKGALLEGLKEVFGEGDGKDPDKMVVLYSRIPVLCVSVDKIKSDISDIKEAQAIALGNQTASRADIAAIKDNLKWGIRLFIGTIVTAGLGGIITLLITHSNL